MVCFLIYITQKKEDGKQVEVWLRLLEVQSKGSRYPTAKATRPRVDRVLKSLSPGEVCFQARF